MGIDMKKIVFATGNEGKMREIRLILKDLPFEVLSIKEAGIEVEIEENGTTYEENSLIKARAVAEHTDALVLADDSGFEVDYLDKKPGVYSARFMGEDTPYSVKNSHIIESLKGVEGDKRSARFVAAITCVYPDGKYVTVRDTLEGRVAEEMAGTNGFGYDPILFLPEYGCTSAQLTTEEKNRISHRGKALNKIKELLAAYEDTCSK